MKNQEAVQLALMNEHQFKFSLDIQLFSEETPPEGTPEGEPTGDEGGEVTPPAKTFTQEELDAIIDKRLARERKKFQSDQSEAEKLAKMNKDEKKAYEEEKKLKDLEEREQALNKRELRAEALSTMNEKGLPNSLVEYLNFKDAESCNASIDTLAKAFNEALEKGIEARVKGSAPLKKPGSNEASESDAVYKAMMGR